jgi:hypothetical protein
MLHRHRQPLRQCQRLCPLDAGRRCRCRPPPGPRSRPPTAAGHNVAASRTASSLLRAQHKCRTRGAQRQQQKQQPPGAPAHATGASACQRPHAAPALGAGALQSLRMGPGQTGSRRCAASGWRPAAPACLRRRLTRMSTARLYRSCPSLAAQPWLRMSSRLPHLARCRRPAAPAARIRCWSAPPGPWPSALRRCTVRVAGSSVQPVEAQRSAGGVGERLACGANGAAPHAAARSAPAPPARAAQTAWAGSRRRPAPAPPRGPSRRRARSASRWAAWRGRLLAADGAAQLKAVHLGQHHVQDGRVKTGRPATAPGALLGRVACCQLQARGAAR